MNRGIVSEKIELIDRFSAYEVTNQVLMPFGGSVSSLTENIGSFAM